MTSICLYAIKYLQLLNNRNQVRVQGTCWKYVSCNFLNFFFFLKLHAFSIKCKSRAKGLAKRLTCKDSGFLHLYEQLFSRVYAEVSISRLQNFSRGIRVPATLKKEHWNGSARGRGGRSSSMSSRGRTHLDRVDDQTHEGRHELVRRILALRVGFVLREVVRQRQRVRVSQGGHVGVVRRGRGVIQGGWYVVWLLLSMWRQKRWPCHWVSLSGERTILLRTVDVPSHTRESDAALKCCGKT